MSSKDATGVDLLRQMVVRFAQQAEFAIEYGFYEASSQAEVVPGAARNGNTHVVQSDEQAFIEGAASRALDGLQASVEATISKSTQSILQEEKALTTGDFHDETMKAHKSCAA